MSLIFWVSSRSVPGILLDTPDFVLHVLGYFLMGVLAVRAFGRGLTEPANKHRVYLGLVFSFLYAMSDEWHQSYVAERVASLEDIVADGLGILVAGVGLILYWRLSRKDRDKHESVLG